MIANPLPWCMISLIWAAQNVAKWSAWPDKCCLGFTLKYFFALVLFFHCGFLCNEPNSLNCLAKQLYCAVIVLGYQVRAWEGGWVLRCFCHGSFISVWSRWMLLSALTISLAQHAGGAHVLKEFTGVVQSTMFVGSKVFWPNRELRLPVAMKGNEWVRIIKYPVTLTNPIIVRTPPSPHYPNASLA